MSLPARLPEKGMHNEDLAGKLMPSTANQVKEPLPLQRRLATSSGHVFVCHSSKDTAFVERCVEQLEGESVRCWVAPRDIAPGTIWSKEIVRAIRASAAIIVVISPNATESPQVLREVERAVDRRVPVIPVWHSPCRLSEELEYFLYCYISLLRRCPCCHWNDVSRKLQILPGNNIVTSAANSIRCRTPVPERQLGTL